MRRRPSGRRLSVFLVEERPARGTAVDARRHVLSAMSKSSALAGIVLDPAAGVEPALTRSERVVLPLDEAGVSFCRGCGGNRTRQRPSKSRLLDPQATHPFVGRLGVGPRPFELKARCTPPCSRPARHAKGERRFFLLLLSWVIFAFVHRERIELSWPEGAPFTAEPVSIPV